MNVWVASFHPTVGTPLYRVKKLVRNQLKTQRFMSFAKHVQNRVRTHRYFSESSGITNLISIRHRNRSNRYITLLHRESRHFSQQWQLSASFFWPASSPRPRPSPPALRECYNISWRAYACSRCSFNSVGVGCHRLVQHRSHVAAARRAASNKRVKNLAGKFVYVLISRCDIRARICLV